MLINTTATMLNSDGSAYHLHALPQDIASTIIFVGDPRRSDQVAAHFDKIELKKSNREFVVQTGYLNNKKITVIGTGISTSNIDIVINEIDALINVDLKSKTIKKDLTKLKIIRLGTSGALQEDIPINSLIISSHAFAFDGLLNYYLHSYNHEEKLLLNSLQNHFDSLPTSSGIYLSQGDTKLINLFKPLGQTGITLTSCGFYGPQRRQIRAPLIKENIIELANKFNFQQQRITNMEMETAAIYGLGKLLNHECCSISTIVANRISDEKINNTENAIEEMIENVLRIIKLECV